MSRKGHRGRKPKEREVSPGFTRKKSFHTSAEGLSVEELLRSAFEKLLPQILEEVAEQNRTLNVRAFNAFADIQVQTGHKLHITVSGEPPSLMDVLGGGFG